MWWCVCLSLTLDNGKDVSVAIEILIHDMKNVHLLFTVFLFFHFRDRVLCSLGESGIMYLRLILN